MTSVCISVIPTSILREKPAHVILVEDRGVLPLETL